MSRTNASRPHHPSTGSASSGLPALGGTQPRVFAGHGVNVEIKEKERFQGVQQGDVNGLKAASPEGSLAAVPTVSQRGTARQSKYGSLGLSPTSSSAPPQMERRGLPDASSTTQSLPDYLPTADDNAGEDPQSESEVLQPFERRNRSENQIDHALLQRPVLERQVVDSFPSSLNADARGVRSSRPNRSPSRCRFERSSYKKVPLKPIRPRTQSQSETQTVSNPERSAGKYTTWPMDGISDPVDACVVRNPHRSAAKCTTWPTDGISGPVEATTSATEAWSRRRLKKALRCAPLDHANFASKTSSRNSSKSTAKSRSKSPQAAGSQQEGPFSEREHHIEGNFPSEESVMFKIRPGRVTRSPDDPRQGNLRDASLLGETPVLAGGYGAAQGFKPEILSTLPSAVEQCISAEDMRKSHKMTEVQYMGWDSTDESMRTDRPEQSDSDANQEEDKWGDLVGDMPFTSGDVFLKSTSERPEKEKVRFCPHARPLLSRMPTEMEG
jgi:hypothetical protein